jgi:His/Glu/Gln/Arg/opine family amino acid ABC transporter permease subunit
VVLRHQSDGIELYVARSRAADRFWYGYLPTAVAITVVLFTASQIKWSFIATLDFTSLWKYRVALWQGVLNTLILTGLSVALGTLGGTLLAVGSQLRFRPLRWLIAAYVELFRNTPLVLQLFWIHFAIPRVTGISTTPFESGVIAITLQSTAYLADVARAGIQAVPIGQWEAADALGLSSRVKWFEIILLQALRIVIPPLANIAVGYFKSSAALALLSVGELMTVTSRIAQYSFKPIEAYTIAGAIYLLLGAVLSSLTYRLERACRVPGARL